MRQSLRIWFRNNTGTGIALALSTLFVLLCAIGIAFDDSDTGTASNYRDKSAYTGTWKSGTDNNGVLTVIRRGGTGTTSVTDSSTACSPRNCKNGHTVYKMDFRLEQTDSGMQMRIVKSTSNALGGSNPYRVGSTYFLHLSEDGKVLISIGVRPGVAVFSVCKVSPRPTSYVAGCYHPGVL